MSDTVSSDSVAQDQLRAFVERILRMREEDRAIKDDIREIYAEAKDNGFDKTVIGQIVSYAEKKTKDPALLAERGELFELYLAAWEGREPNLADGTGTRVALTHTHETKSEAAETSADAEGRSESASGAAFDKAPLQIQESRFGLSTAALTSSAGTEGDDDRQPTPESLAAYAERLRAEPGDTLVYSEELRSWHIEDGEPHDAR